MSNPCLIAYDIANPRRLVRLHRALKRFGIPIQYSVFHAHLSEAGICEVADIITSIIDPKADDVRLYRLPRDGWACNLGRSVLPLGITATALPLPFRATSVIVPISDDERLQPFSSNKIDPPRPPCPSPRRSQRAIEARMQTGLRKGIQLL